MVLDGIEQLERDFARALPELEGGLWHAVDAACKEGAGEAKTQHRYEDKTGDLTKSIDGQLTHGTRQSAEGVIVAKAKYASFVEEGTKAHVIRPKAGAGFVGPLLEGQSRKSRGRKGTRMLAWEQPQGDWHYAREVHHPGTRAYGFMGQAYTKAERVLEREVERAVDAMSRAFAR